MLELLQDCIGELCLKCGRYENEHKGACEGCRWHEIKMNGYHKRCSSDQAMLDLAEDMIFLCEECEEISQDELGNEYVSRTCPFYRDGWCAIGNPDEWNI